MAISTLNAELALIQPSGHLNAAKAVDFEHQLTQAILSGRYSALLVDMHRIESLDSAGLIALVSAFRLAQRRQKRFGLANVAPSIRIIFELTQLDRAFEIFESREAFITAVTQPQEDMRLIA